MFICLITAVLALKVGAQELRRLDFESQIPGEFPRSWNHAWGEQGDDLLLVTNLHSVSGRQSLLLDRESSTNTAQWGACASLPTPVDGWLYVSLAFRVEGKGNNAHFGIELRNGPARALSLRFAYNRLGVHTNMAKPPENLRGGALGSYAPNSWYRLRLWLPTQGQARPDAWAQLEHLTQTGYEPVGPPVAVACTMAKESNALLMLNMSPNHRNFRLFIDDLTCRKASALPEQIRARE